MGKVNFQKYDENVVQMNFLSKNCIEMQNIAEKSNHPQIWVSSYFWLAESQSKPASLRFVKLNQNYSKYCQILSTLARNKAAVFFENIFK